MLRGGYDLSEEEAQRFRTALGTERVVYEVKEDGKPVFQMHRSWTQKPKALNYGPKPYHIVPKEGSHIVVLVEDIFSAIRVSHYTSALPLFGASMKDEIRSKLLKDYNDVVIWLDEDKRREGLLLYKALRGYGVNVSVLSSEHDPKDLDEGELFAVLSTHCIDYHIKYPITEYKPND